MCFVMELCSGGDLSAYIRKRLHLKESHAKYFFNQIVRGLAALHRNRILHRDLKLENVMISASGEVKIGDFGVSKKMRHSEKCYDQAGTPAYLAPELISPGGYSGFKADMWSAGCLLYAMIVGCVPFIGASIDELHTRILNCEYNYQRQAGSVQSKGNGADRYSEGVKDLITKLLTKDPAKRLSAEEALQHPWL